MKRVKKRVGRPPGRKAPERPILSTRVPEDLFEEIRTAAKKWGRNMSEELIWRVREAYQWEKARTDVQTLLADAKRTIEGNLRQALRDAGFTLIRGKAGDYWAEPGVTTPPPEVLSPEFKAAMVEACRQAIAEDKEKPS